MKLRDILRALKDDGWVELPGRGSSHRQFTHPTKPGRVTVPFHGGNADVQQPLLGSIARQSGLKLGRK